MKQGSISNYFYIVLSGQLEEFTMLDGKKNPKCVLSAGDSIGRANLKKESRSTCVSVVMPCELIVIDKNEFIRVYLISHS